MALPSDEQVHEQLTHAREQHERLTQEYHELLANRDVIQEDRDSVRQLVEEAAANMHRLELAAERIAKGTYGRCVRCGQPIATERLEAIPDATTCVSCS
jgi:RNA polymerase-binding transcription factor DksA